MGSLDCWAKADEQEAHGSGSSALAVIHEQGTMPVRSCWAALAAVAWRGGETAGGTCVCVAAGLCMLLALCRWLAGCEWLCEMGRCVRGCSHSADLTVCAKLQQLNSLRNGLPEGSKAVCKSASVCVCVCVCVCYLCASLCLCRARSLSLSLFPLVCPCLPTRMHSHSSPHRLSPGMPTRARAHVSVWKLTCTDIHLVLLALAHSTDLLCLLTLVCMCVFARAQCAGVKNRLLKRVIAGTEWEPASEVATGTNNMWIIINDGASDLPDFPKQG